MVGRKLQQDMEKSGIHLTAPGAREKMQQLMNLNHHYPSLFNQALVRAVVTVFLVLTQPTFVTARGLHAASPSCLHVLAMLCIVETARQASLQ